MKFRVRTGPEGESLFEITARWSLDHTDRIVGRAQQLVCLSIDRDHTQLSPCDRHGMALGLQNHKVLNEIPVFQLSVSPLIHHDLFLPIQHQFIIAHPFIIVRWKIERKVANGNRKMWCRLRSRWVVRNLTAYKTKQTSQRKPYYPHSF